MLGLVSERLITGAPFRIQRKRTKGWRKPPTAVCVDRSTKWGNPYTATSFGTVACVEMFRAEWQQAMEPTSPSRFACTTALAELRGRDLACWCRLCPAHTAGKPRGSNCTACAPCHADVLLELANRAALRQAA